MRRQSAARIEEFRKTDVAPPICAKVGVSSKAGLFLVFLINASAANAQVPVSNDSTAHGPHPAESTAGEETLATPAQSDRVPAANAIQPDSADATSNEIIVTAQRREQRLQDVPIAITAISGDDLTRLNIPNLAGLNAEVPSLHISGFAAANASNLVGIRGIIGQATPIGAGNPVAIYLDGVYLPRPDAAFFELDDVERVEVLRGPQPTLYGRNATAGVINIVTRQPGNLVQGGVNATYGNYDWWTLRGSVSGPLGPGLAAGISASYSDRKGIFVNNVTGNNFSSRKAGTVRGKLRFESPGNDFDATLAADYSSLDNPYSPRNGYAFPLATFAGFGDPDQVSIDAPSEDLSKRRVRSRGVGLTMNYDVNERLRVTSISGVRKITIDTNVDLDGSPVPAFLSSADNSSKSFNQEGRAVFTAGKISATAGVNYFSEDAELGLSLLPPTVSPDRQRPRDKSDLKAWAAFAQLEFGLTDQLTLMGGLRYNHEERNFTIRYRVPGSILKDRVKDSAFMPSVGLNYRPTRDLSFYAKANRGYQAPGFNAFPGPTATVADVFGPETLWAYEAGMKSTWLDSRFAFNFAAFYYDYTDLQVRTVTGVGLFEFENAASARIKGLEAELAARITPRLLLRGHLSFLDSQYTDYCEPLAAGTPQAGDPFCIGTLAPSADRSGNYLPQAPKWSGGANISYTVPIRGIGDGRADVSYKFETNSFFAASNEPLNATGGWHSLDARFGLELDRGPELYVFGRNLTNDRFRAFGVRFLPSILSMFWNDPRTYGVGISYRFH